MESIINDVVQQSSLSAMKINGRKTKEMRAATPRCGAGGASSERRTQGMQDNNPCRSMHMTAVGEGTLSFV